MTEPRIEDLVLQHDRRGISLLQAHLPADNFCQTAQYVLDHPGAIIITTGFYVNGIAETDGPPGALALAKALHALGRQVHVISDHYCTPLLEPFAGNSFNVIEFPITGESKSRSIAGSLIEELQPALMIAVERCGQTIDGRYCNMRGVEITACTARLDHLFLGQPATIGIGDGGNEIGMGKLFNQLSAIPSLIANPTTTATQRLLIATVSNWAVYGLLTELSRLCDRNLLPSVEEQRALLHEIVARGSTNGVSGLVENKVDGYDDSVNDGILAEMHSLLATLPTV